MREPNGNGAPAPERLRTLDLRSLWEGDLSIQERYDIAYTAVSLQGLINRERPRILIYGMPYGDWAKFAPPDDFDGNIDRLVLACSQREGGWLRDTRLEPVGSLQELIEAYRDEIPGLVVWDDAVEATANVATTVAGVEGLLPVRFAEQSGGRQTLYQILNKELGLEVKRSLVGLFTGRGQIPDTGRPSTGSAKCDAYLWSKALYLDTGRCRAGLIGYYQDAYARNSKAHHGHWIALRDYFVSERAFVVDVSVWADEAPIDDPRQPLGTDRNTLDEVLESAYSRTRGSEPIRVFGFPPWAEKYTNHEGVMGNHGAVETEWELARVITPYNGHLVVDIYQGFTGNLSLYRHAPPFEGASDAPTGRSLEAAGATGSPVGGAVPASSPEASLSGSSTRRPRLNILFYMGDYCDIGAVYNILPVNWMDPKRGEIPLGWSFTPVMTELLPDLFRWMYETRTPNDHFMLGPGLYGYNMPNELPSGTAYEQNDRLAQEWCRRLGMDVTGFFIGYQPPSPKTLELYARATPAGVLTNHFRSREAGGPVPHLGMYDLCTPGSPLQETVDKAVRHVESMYRTEELNGIDDGFVAFRCIWVEPSFIVAVSRVLRERLSDVWIPEVVDPHTFFGRFDERRRSVSGQEEVG